MTPRDDAVDAAVAELQRHPNLSITEASKKFGCARTTVRDNLAAAGGRAEPSNPGEATLIGDANSKPEDLLIEQGLKPEEWEIVRFRTGEWGNPDSPSSQVRFDAVPKALIDLTPEPYTPLPKPVPPTSGDTSFVICGDHHAPHQDPGLHAAFCSLLSDERPALLVVLGDLVDYATVSRHRDTLGFANSVRECNRAAYKLLHDYRSASPKTQVVLFDGNHDARLEHYIHDNAPEAWNVGPAFEEELPMYSLRRLWRLDELGVEYIEGDWERTTYKLTDSLTIRHGYMTSKNAAETMLNKHSRSQVQGHDHRLKVTYKTKHDPIDVRLHATSGCMCKIEEGLGYAAEPDWQQGCLFGHTWEGGDFSLAAAPYIEGHGLLLPDGRRYSA